MSMAENAIVAQARNNATMIAPKIEDFQAMLGKYQIKIAQVAPKKGLQADRIIAMTAMAMWMNKSLHDCDPKSMLMCTLQLAMNGLNPSPQFKEAYLIPYGRECQMQLGYLGIIKLVRKSAMVKAVWAECVYEGDEFSPVKGTNPSIHHVAGPNDGDPSKVVGAYAVAIMDNGERVYEYLNKVRLERLRMKSPMQKSGMNGAWKTDYDQMARAKAVKALCKFMPMEDEYRSALFLDESIANASQFDAMTAESMPQPQYTDQEGSAEVVADTPASEVDPLQAQLAKEAAAQGELDLKGGGK